MPKFYPKHCKKIVTLYIHENFISVVFSKREKHNFKQSLELVNITALELLAIYTVPGVQIVEIASVCNSSQTPKF